MSCSAADDFEDLCVSLRQQSAECPAAPLLTVVLDGPLSPPLEGDDELCGRVESISCSEEEEEPGERVQKEEVEEEEEEGGELEEPAVLVGAVSLPEEEAVLVALLEDPLCPGRPDESAGQAVEGLRQFSARREDWEVL